MHPIERLRYVARASGADQPLLVRETALALAAFHDDAAGLVAACRRVIERHPTSAPLWWLCARVLTAPDGQQEAWRAVEEIEADPTARLLAHDLPDEGTVCVVGWPEVVTEALLRRGDVAVLAIDSAGEAGGRGRRRRPPRPAADDGAPPGPRWRGTWGTRSGSWPGRVAASPSGCGGRYEVGWRARRANRGCRTKRWCRSPSSTGCADQREGEPRGRPWSAPIAPWPPS